MRLKAIICTTDFSETCNHAVSYGVALARKLDAKLYMCHVIDISYAAKYSACSDPTDLEDRITNYAAERLQELVGSNPVNWEPLISKGRPSTEIARFAEETDANLVISAAHRRSGIEKLILGSVTEQLMRTLTCPLLVVHSPQPGFVGPEHQQLKLDRILTGCDFSPHSDLSYQYALSLAQQFGSELHLAHVLETPTYNTLLKSVAASGENRRYALADELNGKLTEMICQGSTVRYSPRKTLLAGEPYEELTKYAITHNIDLIVLGVRGNSLKETLHLGSTTDRVIRQAPCPVLCVCPTCTKLWYD